LSIQGRRPERNHGRETNENISCGVLAKNLKKEFGSSCDTITDLKASKEYFIKAVAPKLGQYGSVVFATHGLFSNKVPSLLEPFLALTMVPPGTDGFLKMSEVMGLKMNADVVALTACQTGLGRELSGEGVPVRGSKICAHEPLVCRGHAIH
jgi:CHAT domain-containing protein